MLYAMIAMGAAIVAVRFYNGEPFVRWAPRTFRGRVNYLAFGIVGIIVMIVVARLVRGHWH